MTTLEILKDYKHASKLFVGGGDYRLNPKNSFLFHVYIDLNDNLISSNLKNTLTREIGLLAKSTDLPKFTYDIKNFNEYNRVNLVQSKIRYDELNLNFHDDNADIVRTFYYDYFRYYYRDSDYGNGATPISYSNYMMPHKYHNENLSPPQQFGYTRRQENEENFIRAIRLYSLHQQRFSEYILINPYIKNFRHGTHANDGDSKTLEHSMTIVYENLLYNGGKVEPQSVMGFLDLHYDLNPSPLPPPPAGSPSKTNGGSESAINGLDFDGPVTGSAGSGAATTGRYSGGNPRGSNLFRTFAAALPTVVAVNTARGSNLPKALLSEATSIFTREASRAIINGVDNTMISQNRNGYQVPVINNIDGTLSTNYTGTQSLTTTASLVAGAAVLLNNTISTNRYRSDPVTQSTPVKPTTYNPGLPLNPGLSIPATVSADLNIINDQQNFVAPTNQQTIDRRRRLADIELSIDGINKKIAQLSIQAAEAQNQIDTTQNLITQLNLQITTTQALTPPLVPPPGFDLIKWTNDKNLLLEQYNQELRTMISFQQMAQANLTKTINEINTNKALIDKYAIEKNGLL